jgi:hypothetical protein
VSEEYEIEACVFCDSHEEDDLYIIKSGQHFWQVMCFCGRRGPRSDTKQGAAENWNKTNRIVLDANSH